MNQNVRNIKTSVSNLVGIVTTTLRVTTQVTADVSGVAIRAVEQSPDVVKATAQLPFSARTGYIMQHEGTDYVTAHKKAYAPIEQPLDVTIEMIGISTGAALAAGWTALNAEDNNADK